jgi:hypothetical protein
MGSGFPSLKSALQPPRSNIGRMYNKPTRKCDGLPDISEASIMNWTAVSRHAFRLAVGLAAALAAYGIMRQADVARFTVADVEGINSLISLIGSIYAVVFAFVIFVIWGQFTGVEEATLRECSRLNELLRFSQYLSPDASRAIRRAVTEYTQCVSNSEWRSLGERRKDQPTDKSFAVLISTVVRAEALSPAEEVTHERLIDIARKLAAQRDERIAKSLTRIPPTLLLLVRTMVVALLLLVFIYPFHSSWVGAACFSTVAIILFFSNLVMTDTDNPFDGVFNVSSQPFTDLTL